MLSEREKLDTLLRLGVELAGEVEIDFVDRPAGASFVFNNVFASTGGSGTCGACGSAGGGCA